MKICIQIRKSTLTNKKQVDGEQYTSETLKKNIMWIKKMYANEKYMNGFIRKKNSIRIKSMQTKRKRMKNV